MKNFIFSFLTVFLIFGSYIFVVPYPSFNPLIPFLWSLLFIYLYGKNHLNIAINSYLILLLILYADKMNFSAVGIRTQFAYSSIVMLMTFIFVFIYQELAGTKLRVATLLSYIIAFFIYIIPVSYIIYALNFGIQINDLAISAVAQSNLNESIEFIKSYISFYWLIPIVAVAVFIGFLLLGQEKKETEKIEKSLLSIMIIFIFSTSLLQYKDLRLYNYIQEGTQQYKRSLKIFKDAQKKRKVNQDTLKAQKTGTGETYIVIIGESLNKRHMGLYGYLRNTTPLLSKEKEKGNLLLLQNAYANHTQTMQVLSLALTEANQQNQKKYFNSPSIINILNRADFETYWITNQSLYGVWDNLVSIIAHDADHLISINNTTGKRVATQRYDGALIAEVAKILAQKSTKHNRVIFVHLMGNHVDYKARYPQDKFTFYHGNLDKGEFGNLAGMSWERRIKDLFKRRTNIKDFIREASGKQMEDINHYDNSVVYNDYVVGSILNALQKQKGVSGLVYMSDHADDIISGLGHNAATFTYEMAQIPLIAWFSYAYKERYPNKYHTFADHSNLLFSNDFLYDTLIGMFDINTTKYNPVYDLTSTKYMLKPDNAFIMHGKKLYTATDNAIWWQKENIRYLIDHNLSNRIFPHRVDSIGKLKDIWRDGFRSFEVDVQFDTSSNNFIVGHNEDVLGKNLETFLSTIDYTHIERIWLDFKNLNAKNYQQALKKLEYLDKKFGIRKKCIVETHMKSIFHFVREAGWHTSDYLSTASVTKLLDNNDTVDMKKLAQKLAKELKEQKLSAISFDNRLYPFVKQYIEPLIPNEIVYHTWWGPDLYDADFREMLQKNELFIDKRVKTILCRYKSHFDL